MSFKFIEYLKFIYIFSVIVEWQRQNVKDESCIVKGKREKGLKLNTLIQKIYLLYSSIVKLNNISAIRNLFFFTRVHLQVTSCKQLFDFTITHSIFYLYWSIRQSQKIVLLAVWQPALRKLEKICSCNSYQKQRSKHRWGSLLFSYCSIRLM